MKKIVTVLLMVGTLGATAALASNENIISETKIGYSYLDLGEGTTGQGAELGWDVSFPMSIRSIELGFGINADFYSLSGNDASYQSLVGGADVHGTAGYRFLDGKVKAEAALGYAYISLSDNFALTGVQYSGSLQYKINKRFALEAVYTAASLDPTLGSGTFDINKIGINLRIKH